MIIQLLGMSQQLTYAANIPSTTTYTTSVADPSDAFTGVQINGTSFDVRDSVSYPNFSGRSTWLTGAGTTGDYEVRCTVISGTIDSVVDGVTQSATGVWLPMNSIRRWGIARSAVGTRTTVITLEVRAVYSATVLDTGTYTLVATVT